MNLKKVKRLRRALRNSGTGDPETQYQQHPKRGYIAMIPTCRRAIYQAIKHNDIRGRRS